MNHSVAASTLSSLESDSKNYKSLFEEIAQNDTTIYLNDSLSDDIIRYVDETTQCCCCKVHRRQSSFIAGAPVSKTFNIPMYNTIWIGEMKNATDYIEYLNETRRNSFNSLNKDNRSNYYKLMLSDEVNSSSKTKSRNDNFLQVPTLTANEHQRPLTPEFKDISMKIDQIHTLDQSTNQLIYKAIEVHADILVRLFFRVVINFVVMYSVCHVWKMNRKIVSRLKATLKHSEEARVAICTSILFLWLKQ